MTPARRRVKVTLRISQEAAAALARIADTDDLLLPAQSARILLEQSAIACEAAGLRLGGTAEFGRQIRALGLRARSRTAAGIQGL